MKNYDDIKRVLDMYAMTLVDVKGSKYAKRRLMVLLTETGIDLEELIDNEKHITKHYNISSDNMYRFKLLQQLLSHLHCISFEVQYFDNMTAISASNANHYIIGYLYDYFLQKHQGIKIINIHNLLDIGNQVSYKHYMLREYVGK